MRYLCYILPFAGTLVVIRLTIKMPRELFRKLLHAAAFTSTPVIMWLAPSWPVAVAVLVAFGVVVWPILALVERFDWYADLFIERRLHEVRRSLLILFWGNALVVAVCWGVFNKPVAASAAILMWGFGDAAAALVGKRWGRHCTGMPLADPHKTWEGSGAMWAVAALVGTVALMVLGGLPLGAALLRALVTGLVGAYVELITKRGYDTITVPVAQATLLLALC